MKDVDQTGRVPMPEPTLPADAFAHRSIWKRWDWFGAVFVLLAGWLFFAGRERAPLVVVYTSQDQEYAEPILRDFTRQTGIAVRTAYDNEAVKTVGLVNRLLAERDHPQCDVFWNNEELRTRQLAARGVFRERDSWRAMGYRSRRLVINTNCLTLALAPTNWTSLTNQCWRGKVALAYPLFGTTATHFLALRQEWGDPSWQQWCRALQANQPYLVDGNSVVVKLVGRGEAWIGLTDSDDVRAAQREGLPLRELPLMPESWLIPNTVAVLRQAPHPEAAQQLFVYLQSQPVLDRLQLAHALEGASATQVLSGTLAVHWDELLRDLEPATLTLQRIFLR
jgi:iron(III) transport system substrate-binding protein